MRDILHLFQCNLFTGFLYCFVMLSIFTADISCWTNGTDISSLKL